MNATSASELVSVLSQLNTHTHFHEFDDVALFRLMQEDRMGQAARMIPHTAGQLRQDIFVAVASGFKQGGYFVEVGATDGVYLSNTLMLEKQLGWQGVLAEPARFWHKALHENRSAIIETRCVHSQTGQTLQFSEVTDDQGLSTISEYAEGDLHSVSRRTNTEYPVESISLSDLLKANNAPAQIDFLSIDTEGSELDILSSFDFGSYQFGLICCEHNYTPQRSRILELLKSQGYVRVLDGISQFDDWYVHSSKLEDFAAAFPAWQDVSTQEDSTEPRVLSENAATIQMLQGTMDDLIVERDAYRAALTEKQAALTEKEATMQLLTETIENLIVDRDAHKAAAQTAMQKKKGWRRR